MDRAKPLQSKIALVTGVGRRAGIGAAICREIAKNGGDVFSRTGSNTTKKPTPKIARKVNATPPNLVMVNAPGPRTAPSGTNGLAVGRTAGRIAESDGPIQLLGPPAEFEHFLPRSRSRKSVAAPRLCGHVFF